MKSRGVVLFLLSLCWASPIFGQSVPSGADPILNQLADEIVREQKVPGLVVAILDDSKVAAIGSSGIRKLGDEALFSPNDRIHIGSCTKSMTATLIAILIEEGSLRWDSTVGEVLPELRGVIHDDYLQVTLTQLLDHQGGIPANAKNWWAKGPDPVSTRDIILRESLTAKPANPPGSKFVYSNLGYVLAGHMAEKVSGLSWEELIRKKLFIPLGMSTAGFGPPNTQDEVDQPWGHTVASGQSDPTPIQSDNAPAMGPAGTVHCSVKDWARFLNWHLHPDLHPKMASAETLQKLRTLRGPDAEAIRGYAGGWIVNNNNPWGSCVLGHSGSNTAWMATVQLVPEKGIGFVAVTNVGGPKARIATDKAIAGLIKIYQDSHKEQPDTSKR